MTRPDVSNSDPWHGQTYVWPVKLDTTQASCVHWAVTAANVVCPVRATRNSPAEDVTSAIPPVVFSGEAALMATDTAPLADVPETVGSGWPGIELAGFDPQPGRIAARPLCTRRPTRYVCRKPGVLACRKTPMAGHRRPDPFDSISPPRLAQSRRESRNLATVSY